MTFDGRTFYNDNVKKEFLDRFNERTAQVYSRIFTASKDTEEMLNKDLYNFGIDEVADLMQLMKPTSVKAARANLSVVVNYIEWCIDKQYRRSNLNPVSKMGNDWLMSFVEEPEFNFFTEEKFREYISRLVNFQDKVVPALIFNGVEGKFMSELLNLKVKDVDFDNNILILTDNNENKRQLEVPKYVIDIIEHAINEKIYLKKNGDVSPNSKSSPEMTLNINDYVLRSRLNKRSGNNPINISTLRIRVKELQDFVGHSNFTVTNIKRSGMLYMAKQLIERDGKLEREQLHEIATRFNSDFLTLTDLERNTYVASLKDVINMTNIKILYGEVL